MNQKPKQFLDTIIREKELEYLTTAEIDMLEIRAYLMNRLFVYLYRKGIAAPLRETGYAFNLSSRQVARELHRYGYR